MARVRVKISWCFLLVLLMAGSAAGQSAPNPAPPNEKVAPWFDLESLTVGWRYRMLENNLGSRTERWSEHHQGFRARLKLDPQAHYSIAAVAFNGDTFAGSWNPRGFNANMSNRLFVKQLYLSAKPI